MGLVAAVAVSLTITVFPNGPGKGSHTWTLRCSPPGGTLPASEAACRRLLALRAPFAPTPGTTLCTQVYGGPQEAVVRGTFAGRRVSIRFTRRNGCAIARWDRVRFLFQPRR
jgi:subtilisin inhibitor-like